MKIAMIASGSRGDVQPYIALGKGLIEAGHQVRITTHRDYEQLVVENGLEFYHVKGDISAIIQSDSMRKKIESGNFLALLSEMAKAAREGAIYLAEAGLAACEDADLILAGMGGDSIAIALSEKLNIPFLPAYLVPFTPTKYFGSVLTANMPALGGWANLVTHKMAKQMMWQSFRKADQAARREVLDLPPAPVFGPDPAAGGVKLPRLYGYSSAVIPVPEDWDADIHVTGYWFLDAPTDWSPPKPLLEFLQAGPPPVYIGFGSMSSENPIETVELILGALQISGGRALLYSGSDAMAQVDLPESVFMTRPVPHAWLFPQMAGVVHHGGVGTTAAGLRAGVPNLVVPFFGDQPYWGKRVHQLGVGPDPIPRKKMTAKRLGNAIARLSSDEVMKVKAASLGEKICAEDGIGQAVEIISRIRLC